MFSLRVAGSSSSFLECLMLLHCVSTRSQIYPVKKNYNRILVSCVGTLSPFMKLSPTQMCAAYTGDTIALISTFRSWDLDLGSRRPRAQYSIFLGTNTTPNWHQRSIYIMILKTEIIQLLILLQSGKGTYFFFLTQIAISFQYNHNLPLCFVYDSTTLSYWQPHTCTTAHTHTRANSLAARKSKTQPAHFLKTK